MIFSQLLKSACIAVVFSLATVVNAQSVYYQSLIDADNNPATGCSVSVSTADEGIQTFVGAELAIRTQAEVGQVSQATSQTVEQCQQGAWQTQSNVNYNPAITLTSPSIVQQAQSLNLSANIRVGFMASSQANFSQGDVLISSRSLAINAPVTPTTSPRPVPAMGGVAFLLMALLLAVFGRRILGHKSKHLAIILFAIGIAGVAYTEPSSASQRALSDWQNVAVYDHDRINDATAPALDIVKTYVNATANSIAIRIDFSRLELGNASPDPINPDPVNPASSFRILSAIVSEPSMSHTVTVAGDSEWIQGRAGQISITNTRTQMQQSIAVQQAGAYTATLVNTQVGDVLQLSPVASDGTLGQTVSVVVQGTPAESALLPDPSTLAPALRTTEVNTLYDLTDFLYKSSPQIQMGMPADTIAPEQAALLVGKVLDKQNNPLPGVKISIKDLPVYGHTTSRIDGQWDLVVNGGRSFVINYEKAGFLPVQRQVQVKWQDYGYLPDVVMIPLDTRVSFINLSDTSKDFQVHQSSYNQDADGKRRTTILFPKGTTASMVLPDDSEQALTQLNVRATEYTVGANGPETMPGELPPASGYTFAAEFSVDQAIAAGASTVTFSQPVVVYEDNFLNFPVGVVVPVGSYSRASASWTPEENGRVIKILAIANGKASLDVRGDGVAADAAALAELHITDAELAQLATLYTAGDSLWRVQNSHFSPWDYNWPYGPRPCPGGAYTCSPPTLEPIIIASLKELEGPPKPPDNPDNTICPGCFIDVQNRAVGESIDLVGVPFNLNYYSGYAGSALMASGGDNSGGGTGSQPRDTEIRVNLTGDKPAASPPITKVTAEMKIAGRTLTKSFSGGLPADYYTTFKWNGHDRYGRKMYACSRADFKVGYHGELVYYANRVAMAMAFATYSRGSGSGSSAGLAFVNRGSINFSFAVYSRGSATVCPPTPNVKTPIDLTGGGAGAPTVNNASIVSANLGGWSPDILHAYDPIRGIITLGNGQTYSSADASNRVVSLKRLKGRLGGVFANGDILHFNSSYIYRSSPYNNQFDILFSSSESIIRNA